MRQLEKGGTYLPNSAKSHPRRQLSEMLHSVIPLMCSLTTHPILVCPRRKSARSVHNGAKY